RRHAAGGRLREVVDAAGAGERQDVAGLRVRCRRLVEGRHVAAEERMLLAQLIVDAADALTLLAVRRLTIRHLSAILIVRLRQVRHELERRRTELRWIDSVV